MHFDKSIQASVAEKFWSNFGCYFIHFLWPVIMRNWGAYEVPEWRSWAWFDQNPPHHLVFIFGQDSDDSRCGLHHLTWADTGLISIFLHVIMLGKCLRKSKIPCRCVCQVLTRLRMRKIWSLWWSRTLSFQADTSEGSFKIQIKLGRFLDQHPDFVLSLFWHWHFGRKFVATWCDMMWQSPFTGQASSNLGRHSAWLLHGKTARVLGNGSALAHLFQQQRSRHQVEPFWNHCWNRRPQDPAKLLKKQADPQLSCLGLETGKMEK